MMQTFIIPVNWLTLANEQQTMLQQIQNSFNAPTTYISTNGIVLIFIIALCAAITFGVWKWKIKDEKHLGKSYRTLAASLKLNWYDRLILNKTAMQFGLINGSGMIISQGTFDHVISKLKNKSATGKLTRKQITKLNNIRTHLFTED